MLIFYSELLYLTSMEKSEAVSYYHDQESQLEKDALLTHTYEDLNMEDFFHQVNHTSSCVGEQYLYHVLHYDNHTGVEKHEPLLTKLKEKKELRHRLTECLKKLSHPDAYYITSLFFKSFPIAPAWERRLLFICRFIPFLLGGLFALHPNTALLFLWLAAIVGNTVLHYRNKMKIQEYCFAIPQLIRLILTAEALNREEDLAQMNHQIKDTIKHLKILKQSLASFKISIRLQSDMAMLIYMFTEIFNIFFLSEAYRVNKAFLLLKEEKERMKDAFRFVGMIDMLCSISFFRESLPYYCLPQKTSQRHHLTAKGIYHPLIEDCTANDLTLTGKSMLITGSNMSGKTSFIRTIGTNLLAAKTLHTCFAEEFCYPDRMGIASSIHITDSLMSGKSFFLQEVELIKEILESCSDGNFLILIDEPFKGTNTQERIAIGKAVLASLAESGNTVVVSTHDLELGRLLNPLYDSYYFCETVEENILSFDYKLKRGIAKERNAIKILEIFQYPSSIIKEAYRSCLPTSASL